MKLSGNGAVFAGVRIRLRGVHMAAFALLLLALPVSTADAQPASRAGAHVYLMRGVLNIFSLGMDEIAAKLQAQGINATVHNHMVWSAIADEAAAEYRSGRVPNIILVGHSSGATVLPDIVARMDQLGAPVKLAIGLDSVFRTSLQGRVGKYMNFYISDGAGEPVQRTAGLKGSLENIDMKNTGVGHMSIDKSEMMQRRIIAAIDAAIRSPSPGYKPVDASAAARQRGPATANAAAAR